MTEKTKKGDFVEIDFSAYTHDGILFDTTRESDAKKAGVNLNKNKKIEPIVVCIGEKMLLREFDKALENKEVGKDYELTLKPEQAFGKRDPKLIKAIPLSAFTEIPRTGMFVNVNGFIAKVISVTSGRALVDMNNPLAGKEILYKFRIKEIVKDNKKKIYAIAKAFGIEIENILEEDSESNKVKISLKKFNTSKAVDKKILEQFQSKIKESANIECEILTKEY